MAALFHLTIMSSDKKIFEGDLQSMVVPGEAGYMGVLANHAPLLSTLVPGKITLRDDSGRVKALKSEAGGFLEVLHNKAVILVD